MCESALQIADLFDNRVDLNTTQTACCIHKSNQRHLIESQKTTMPKANRNNPQLNRRLKPISIHRPTRKIKQRLSGFGWTPTWSALCNAAYAQQLSQQFSVAFRI